MGRPTDLTPEIADRAEAAALEGVAIRRLGDHIGVPQRTVYDWLVREGEPYESFSHRVKAAAGKIEVGALRRVREGDTGWQSAAWILERRFGMWASRGDDETEHAASARTREEAVAELRKLPPDLLRAALEPRE